METPAAARRHGVRIDALRDEQLLAALPRSHPHAAAGAIPVGAFGAECVLLPRKPPGRAFNAWLPTAIGACGFELARTLEALSAPWDRRMLPVANGEAVSALPDRPGILPAPDGSRGVAANGGAAGSQRGGVADAPAPRTELPDD